MDPYYNENFHLTNWSCHTNDHQWSEEINFDLTQPRTYHTLEPIYKTFQDNDLNHENSEDSEESDSEKGNIVEIEVHESDASSLDAFQGETCDLNSVEGYCVPSTKVKRRDFNVSERCAILKVFDQNKSIAKTHKATGVSRFVIMRILKRRSEYESIKCGKLKKKRLKKTQFTKHHKYLNEEKEV